MKILHSNHKQNFRYFAFIMLFMATLAMSCSNNEEFDSLNQEPENPAEDLLTKANFDTDAFISEWQIPANTTITLPIDTNYEYRFIVDWGDDSDLGYIDNHNYQTQATHKYTQANVYRIKILGCFPAFKWQYSNSCNQYLTQIIQWGNIHIKTLREAFYQSALISIPANIPNVTDYHSAFSQCHHLNNLPDGLFNKCDSAQCFTMTFYDCKNLKTLPPNLFQDCHNAVAFDYTFSESGLKYLPNGVFKNCKSVQTFESVFGACPDLTTIPEDLFEDCTATENFAMAFWVCEKLTSIPQRLFDNCKKVTDFSWTFMYCSSLTGETPKTGNLDLWDRPGKSGYPEIINGDGCFAGTDLKLHLIPKEWGGTLER